MADTVTVDLKLKYEGALLNVNDAGSTLFTRTPTTARGGNPGSVPLTTAETDISLAFLVKPHEVKIKNIGTGVIQGGPKSAGAMVLMFELDPGESTVIPLARSATPTLRMRMVASTGVAQITAIDD